MKSERILAALAAAAGLAVGVGGVSGQTLTPPNGTALAQSWAYPTNYMQTVNVAGGFPVEQFRLIMNGQPTTGAAYHTDVVMRLISPNGTELLIGGDTAGTPYPGAVTWASLPFTGTPPGATTAALAIDATYDFNFGPGTGEWQFNFFHQWTGGSVTWNDIQVVLMTAAPGACCMNDGSCVQASAVSCATQGGAFAGAGVACASANCPQPGACCLANGTCISIIETACTGQGGTYQGAGTLCSGVTCPQPPPVLYDNGGLMTTPAGACIPVGQNSSTLQTNLGLDLFGFGHQVTANNRMADDFTVTGTWNVAEIDFFAYQTGSSPTASTFTSVNFQIWDGPPNDPTSTVVFGDTTTNRMSASMFAGLYRHTDTACDLNRPIFRNTAAAVVTLPAGTYWLDWQTDGTLASGPWAPPVTVTGLTGKPGANGMQSLVGAWGAALDVGFPQDLPFVIRGTTAGGCYPNCDNSTTPPTLNVADFTCFLQAFAAGNSSANCDNSTTPPTLNVADFTCFLQAFAAGC